MDIQMILRVQPYIDTIPAGKERAWEVATRNDRITLQSWHKTWVDQTIKNKENYNFSDNSAMQLHGKLERQPVILMGAGPSLRKNWQELNHYERGRKSIKIITNVHNFSFCEDRNLVDENDFYMVLDAGEICIRELSEGGQNKPEWYWDRTKDRTLIAYHGTHPEFINKWKGPIYWYTTPAASPELAREMTKIVDFSTVPGFNVGGNVMGAALYFARGVLGCSIPIFIGMDLCFSYDQKFHAWETPYDQKFSGVMPATDIFGNRVYTWGSYYGFKSWFDYIATGGRNNMPHIWINATEGGILGSYPEGNIKQIIQLELKQALYMFNTHYDLPLMLSKSINGQLHILF